MRAATGDHPGESPGSPAWLTRAGLALRVCPASVMLPRGDWTKDSCRGGGLSARRPRAPGDLLRLSSPSDLLWGRAPVQAHPAVCTFPRGQAHPVPDGRPQRRGGLSHLQLPAFRYINRQLLGRLGRSQPYRLRAGEQGHHECLWGARRSPSQRVSLVNTNQMPAGCHGHSHTNTTAQRGRCVLSSLRAKACAPGQLSS